MLTGKDQAFKNLRKKTRYVGRAFIIEVDRKLAKATPVLFGVARANWLPSVDSPDSGKVNYPNSYTMTPSERKSGRVKAQPKAYYPMYTCKKYLMAQKIYFSLLTENIRSNLLTLL